MQERGGGVERRHRLYEEKESCTQENLSPFTVPFDIVISQKER